MAKRRDAGMTKQGVRDLSHLKSKSAGWKLPEPPKQAQVCKHTSTREIYVSGDTYCLDCGFIWDWNGEPY